MAGDWVVGFSQRACLEIWSGDHRQTPGGLQQTDEAKRFRRNLLKRPLALRCPTEYIQPQGLAEIAVRYLEGHPDSPQDTLTHFLREDPNPPPALVEQIWAELVGQSEPEVDTQVQKAALVILWMALQSDDIIHICSKTYAEAAGLAGKQRWGLVLSSSARVTRMTYQTVIGVRYPELVTASPTGCTFGRFVPSEEDLLGGFLPVFWDVPRANLHAVVDIGAVVDWLQFQHTYARDAKSSLAVLHNQNDMVTHFKAKAQGAVVSRGVTTCAGMTAHTVIVAQTKVGFLTGGRRASFHDLPQDEQDIQREEAYGRATVALTRARSLCIIMGPLDMKGLLGAATVIGSLMYGAGHVFKGQANFYLHDGSLGNSPSDADFGRLLDRSNSLSSQYLPPLLVIAEALQDFITHRSDCCGHMESLAV